MLSFIKSYITKCHHHSKAVSQESSDIEAFGFFSSRDANVNLSEGLYMTDTEKCSSTNDLRQKLFCTISIKHNFALLKSFGNVYLANGHSRQTVR